MPEPPELHKRIQMAANSNIFPVLMNVESFCDVRRAPANAQDQAAWLYFLIQRDLHIRCRSKRVTQLRRICEIETLKCDPKIGLVIFKVPDLVSQRWLGNI